MKEEKKVLELRDFGPKQWIEFYTCLNEERPVDKLRLDLSDDAKKAYNEELERLKEERKRIPEVSYEINYHDFE